MTNFGGSSPRSLPAINISASLIAKSCHIDALLEGQTINLIFKPPPVGNECEGNRIEPSD
jgi:hypothetical protein